MFKFDFDIDDAELEVDIDTVLNIAHDEPLESENQPKATRKIELESFAEHPLAALLDALPDLISYTPLVVPLSSSRKSVTLLRRDLFDARFQLIAEGAGDAEDDEAPPSSSAKTALGFLENPSDLVPGVYEGGLKTWECSLDLVDHLDSLRCRSSSQFSGKKILELGCGTAIPSAFILHEILSTSSEPSPQKTSIHLQDYNASVLQLVTLPNLLLSWYSSPHSAQYRSSTPDLPPLSLSDPGELPITPELKESFQTSLSSLKITLRFFSGSWHTFEPSRVLSDPTQNQSTTNVKHPHYDLLLTSETIYRLESLPTLIALMRDACTGSPSPAHDLDNLTSNLRISTTSATTSTETNKVDPTPLCLVAAKVLYFGVGGGIPDFITAVQKIGGQVETVLEKKAGVGRKVLQVHW